MSTLKTRLLNIAQADFDANKRAGRRGKEWALESEVSYKALKHIEKLERRIKALEKGLLPFKQYHDHSGMVREPHQANSLVVGVMGKSYLTGEMGDIIVRNKHFRNAAKLLGKVE